MADHKPVKEVFLILPRTIGKEDVDQDNVEKFHNTEYAGKILLEFKPVNVDANDMRLAALSMFRNYDLNEQLNVLHLQTITEKNAYLEGVPGLYSKEIRRWTNCAIDAKCVLMWHLCYKLGKKINQV